ncbi:UDP-N-acetylmuramoyl-tripeptide--D-alanyl-D-alanine ligase, partial [Candidatus Gottesmanbacteria bacterium]|nr:UDP-N-acetylmuramoyl-tripeptide--D-alanyl-D-alanine ligase [Candidatus Gottesmanbacteria bacterium]
MDILILLIAFVWIIRIIGNTLTYSALWRVKEYRLDRMVIHLRTPQGRRFWWPERRRPAISPKSALLVLLSLSISGSIVWTFNLPILLRLAIADILSFPVTWILVLMLNAPTKVYHAILIASAVRKLRSHKQMIVIGVTGSFGKTSTKEFLATILSKKYTVLKTEASKNSPIAIAETVLADLTPETQVFIVEMGAYKRGEIQTMAEMVQPTIGIVTAINAQHQDLFGSLDATMAAKYELIQGLREGNIGIFNADNAFIRRMGERAKLEGHAVWWYTEESSKFKVQSSKVNTKIFVASDITAMINGVEFTCRFGKQYARISVSVLGAHQVSNILAAIAGAVAADMEFAEAVRAASRIQSFPKIMEPVKGIHGATFINDTFNNNPDAAKAAIAYLAKTKGRKMLVFQPMVELGKYAAESH